MSYKARSCFSKMSRSGQDFYVCCAGLCCAALLARYGYRVTVCESHYVLGGAAHGFEVKGHHFDAGPSFFAGLSGNGTVQTGIASNTRMHCPATSCTSTCASSPLSVVHPCADFASCQGGMLHETAQHIKLEVQCCVKLLLLSACSALVSFHNVTNPTCNTSLCVLAHGLTTSPDSFPVEIAQSISTESFFQCIIVLERLITGVGVVQVKGTLPTR